MPLSPLQSLTISATDALREATMSLKRAHINAAALDARVLLQYVLGISHERLLADTPEMTPRQQADYRELIDERCQRKPVAQLTGKREFYGREFKVTEHTLDPRPDSETLIEAVLEYVERYHAPRILDLGTGSGCLLLTLLEEIKNARGVGVDISNEALEVARENAKNLGLAAKAEFVRSHWNEQVTGAFDIIIANPPYIPTNDIAALEPEVSRHEPKLALDGGADGLDCYRAIMPQLPSLLTPGGIAVFEIGMGQAEEVKKIVADCRLLVTGIGHDLNGISRCVIVQKQQLTTSH